MLIFGRLEGEKAGLSVVTFLRKIIGPLKAAPILFLLSPEVSGTSGTMSIYIYIYIYVNNMADF